MRTSSALLCGAALAVSAAIASPTMAAPRTFRYISPVPGSDRVSRWNNVAIREGSALDRSSLSPSRLTVVGSTSGPHTGRLELASDGKTVLFTPDQPYALGETVHVQLAAGLRTASGSTLPALAYDFRVAGVDPRLMPHPVSEQIPEPPADSPWWQQPMAPVQATTGPCDTLLPGFPTIHVANVNNSNPGVYFVAPFPAGASTHADLEILDDLGQPLYQARNTGTAFLCVDFKVQPNGHLTYWTNNTAKFIEMDNFFARVDSFATGNGYATDLHEIQILPNRHALLMSYDPQPVPMDTVVPGGNPNANVIGLIIQELDENKNVVFQWRSWDHFNITDASVSPDVNLLGVNIDYAHGNSIELMPDGNLMISSRHMNELTKIDRQTGDVLWRMGRNALNNEFSFPNDTRGWSHQHDARIQANGNLTVFDNGNNLVPAYSRALEFALDEENLVATKVWEYRHTPDVYGGFMGDVQRHSDGSTTIGWGGTFSPPGMTDLHPDGTVAAELQFPAGLVNYRAFRFPWRTARILADVEEIDVASPAVGTSWGKTFKVWNNWNQPISIDCLRTINGDVFSATLAAGSLPVTLAPGETTLVQAVYNPVAEGAVTSRLYIVQQNTSEMVAQSVVVHGHIDGNVGVEPDAGPVLTTRALPNPLRAGTSIEFTLPSTQRVTLDIYDISGRKIASLLDETRAAGRHVVRWTPAGERGGLYLYRLRAAGKTLVRKLVMAE